MTMMISNLPMDLIEEILSRVPLKSMKAVKLTCQSWNNISKSESFTKMHIGKTTREGENMVIMMAPHNLYLISGVDNDDVDPSIELKGKLSFLHNQVRISRVFHYEGLLLCISNDLNKILVWNPYLGQTRWINLRCSHRPNGWDMFSYALGYEDKESRRGIKLLRFVDYFLEASSPYFWYEIYDFDSGLWTTLDVTPHWGICCAGHSVSLKGNTYWYATERSSEVLLISHIICFDFTKERFGPLLPLPLPNHVDHDYFLVALSCVKEEKLAALFERYTSTDSEFEIWITTKIEVEMVSWSKFLIIDTKPKTYIPISFFIDKEIKGSTGFGRDYDSVYPKTFINIIGEAGYLRKLDPGVPTDQDCSPDLCVYVPSLIQIKEPARGKRKRQSNLEKRRFDQNRLRLTAIEKGLQILYNRW